MSSGYLEHYHLCEPFPLDGRTNKRGGRIASASLRTGEPVGPKALLFTGLRVVTDSNPLSIELTHLGECGHLCDEQLATSEVRLACQIEP